MFRIVLILLIISSQIATSEKYRIFFKDKGGEEFTVGSKLYEKTIHSISPRSLERRKKTLSPDSIVKFEDIPIFENYIQELQRLGVSIILRLKWLNYLVVEMDSNLLQKVSGLSFVRKIQTIGEKVSVVLKKPNANTAKLNVASRIFFTPTVVVDSIYGMSMHQLEMLGISKLHLLGVLGDSILVGILDTGFRWKSHQSLVGATVIDEYDFLYKDRITANEPQDTSGQDIHGTMVFSILAGFSPGKLIGSSPMSMFILGKTEDLRSETRLEEDYFASAIEWMDSAGVDAISSSLGYYKFDSTDVSYAFKDLDGKTALTSIYANKAFERGIVMVTAVGNRGPEPYTLSAPADAFGEIAIGGVNTSGDTVLKFSSRGPTFDGRIKPDFCAMGVQVVSANAVQSDSFLIGTGTSVAAPLISGAIATLISAFEELTPVQVKTLLIQHSSRSKEPDNNFGYGVPDFYAAALDYDIIISHPITFRVFDRQRIIFSVVYKEPISSVKLFIRGISNLSFSEHFLRASEEPNRYFFDIFFENQKDSVFEFYVEAMTDGGRRRRKPFFENKFYRIKIGDKSKNLPIVDKFPISDVVEIENKNLSRVKVFPEIIRDNSSVFININSDEIGAYTFKIYNFVGIELFAEKFEIAFPGGRQKQINLENFANGLYFIEIISPSGKLYLKKFLKL